MIACDGTSWYVIADLRKARQIQFNFDGGGSALTTGAKGWMRVPYSGTITSWELTADQSGSVVVDIWVDSYTNFPPDNSDSITASAPPTLSAQQKNTDSTLTGWTKTFSEGDYFRFNIDSASTVTYVVLALTIDPTTA
jgi:hypothetical protein